MDPNSLLNAIDKLLNDQTDRLIRHNKETNFFDDEVERGVLLTVDKLHNRREELLNEQDSKK